MTLVTPRVVNSVSCVKRIDHESHFAWQAQYLVKLKCHFSWQAQYSVKFGMIAGARNVVFFNRKMLGLTAKCNLGCEAGCRRLTVSWSDRGRIMLGSWSDRPRIVTDELFSRNFLGILESHFSWQAQCLVMWGGTLLLRAL